MYPPKQPFTSGSIVGSSHRRLTTINEVVSPLPEEIEDGLKFFEECLKEKVIVVPGIFFDVNPSHRRDLFSSSCHHFVRLSFGPSMEHIETGLNGIERVLKRYHYDVGEVVHGPIGGQIGVST